MLSASHNPMPDNGIKFLARGGYKLADEVEDAIEQRMGGAHAEADRSGRRKGARGLPTAQRATSSICCRSCRTGSTGCTSSSTPLTVPPRRSRRRRSGEAGAYVTVIGADPDGLNINEGCGSTHLEHLQRAVVENQAHLGIAHDGDADRCLAVDARGSVVDGDQIMCILALAFRERGVLAQDTIVATVMSNLGMLLAMEREGITVRQTAVGDRYVLEDMQAGSFTFGASSPATSSSWTTPPLAMACSLGCCWPHVSRRPAARSPT